MSDTGIPIRIKNPATGAGIAAPGMATTATLGETHSPTGERWVYLRPSFRGPHLDHDLTSYPDSWIALPDDARCSS